MCGIVAIGAYITKLAVVTSRFERAPNPKDPQMKLSYVNNGPVLVCITIRSSAIQSIQCEPQSLGGHSFNQSHVNSQQQ